MLRADPSQARPARPTLSRTHTGLRGLEGGRVGDLGPTKRWQSSGFISDLQSGRPNEAARLVSLARDPRREEALRMASKRRRRRPLVSRHWIGRRGFGTANRISISSGCVCEKQFVYRLYLSGVSGAAGDDRRSEKRELLAISFGEQILNGTSQRERELPLLSGLLGRLLVPIYLSIYPSELGSILVVPKRAIAHVCGSARFWFPPPQLAAINCGRSSSLCWRWFLQWRRRQPRKAQFAARWCF